MGQNADQRVFPRLKFNFKTFLFSPPWPKNASEGLKIEVLKNFKIMAFQKIFNPLQFIIKRKYISKWLIHEEAAYFPIPIEFLVWGLLLVSEAILEHVMWNKIFNNKLNILLPLQVQGFEDHKFVIFISELLLIYIFKTFEIVLVDNINRCVPVFDCDKIE